jgi:hypothetical protein
MGPGMAQTNRSLALTFSAETDDREVLKSGLMQ